MILQRRCRVANHITMRAFIGDWGENLEYIDMLVTSELANLPISKIIDGVNHFQIRYYFFTPQKT